MSQNSNHNHINIIVENDYETTNLEVFQDKPGRIYKCPTKKCYKAYKNRTGLKYHLLKGQCKLQNGTMVAKQLSNVSQANFLGQDSVKPYYCKICHKYYKNLNGVRYHAKVEHPDISFEEIRGVNDDYSES
jgi:hypothetical protein